MRNARAAVLIVLAAEVAVLVVTGIALLFLYRPTNAAAWSSVFGAGQSWSVRGSHALTIVHRVASLAAVPTAIAAGVLLVLRSSHRRQLMRDIYIGAATPLVALSASFSGFLLPWDQLALRAVTVGANIRGYGAIVRGEVLFVINDGVELSTATVSRVLVTHAAVLGGLLVVLVALAWRRRHDAAGAVVRSEGRSGPGAALAP
jgi:quinol-cytochrome oxidoreductase complex cytochrome b subunit